ncbi:MAG: phosphotransferase [Candidatus Limnocylindria bacterium]
MRRELEAMGREITGAPDQFHVRPWSTVFRVPTRSGDVYLKAVPPQLAHEIRLTHWLAREFPGRVLDVLAADDERGFMLLPDGGTRLRDMPVDRDTWCRAAAVYARLQLDVAQRGPELLALGVPDRRLRRLPSALARILPAAERTLIARYAALCDELAAIGLPETLQIEDLHDNNVLVQRDRTRVFDWGDASVAHPFLGLDMFLSFAAARFGVPRDGDEPQRIREMYLEPFTGLAPPKVLRRAAELAARVVPTVRILSWHLANPDAPADDHSAQSRETLEKLIGHQRAALA